MNCVINIIAYILINFQMIINLLYYIMMKSEYMTWLLLHVS